MRQKRGRGYRSTRRPNRQHRGVFRGYTPDPYTNKYYYQSWKMDQARWGADFRRILQDDQYDKLIFKHDKFWKKVRYGAVTQEFWPSIATIGPVVSKVLQRATGYIPSPAGYPFYSSLRSKELQDMIPYLPDKPMYHHGPTTQLYEYGPQTSKYFRKPWTDKTVPQYRDRYSYITTFKSKYVPIYDLSRYGDLRFVGDIVPNWKNRRRWNRRVRWTRRLAPPPTLPDDPGQEPPTTTTKKVIIAGRCYHYDAVRKTYVPCEKRFSYAQTSTWPSFQKGFTSKARYKYRRTKFGRKYYRNTFTNSFRRYSKPYRYF